MKVSLVQYAGKGEMRQYFLTYFKFAVSGKKYKKSWNKLKINEKKCIHRRNWSTLAAALVNENESSLDEEFQFDGGNWQSQ